MMLYAIIAIGNNTGVCSSTNWAFGSSVAKAHAIYLVFADLVYSAVKSLSHIITIIIEHNTIIYAAILSVLITASGLQG